MPTLAAYLSVFLDTFFGHIALAIYLSAIMDERCWGWLKKLPTLLPSPILIAFLSLGLQTAFPEAVVLRLCVNSLAVILMCTLWVRWAWQTGFWRAFAAVCLGGVFQVALTCLSRILLDLPTSDESLQYVVVLALYFIIVLGTAALLRRLRFGGWFRLLEHGPGQRQIALFLFALEIAMQTFFVLQKGVQPDYLVPYYLLVMVLAVLTVGLVVYLAQRLDAERKVEAQRDVIAQQQLYERDLEAIQQEVRAFRHDYKNLLAGLSEQAGKGELDKLRASLSQLDTGFDRHIGEKIQSSVHLGNVRIPQVRSLLLSKLAAMRDKKIDCRLEALYPVERVGIDPWDFTRCLGILLDNAAEAALETETSWVEIVLLSQKSRLFLRVSNPYTGAVDPDKIWMENFSTKGKNRGLGLPSYQRILAGYPNTATSTSWADGVFVQELIVEENA